jgi:thioredoxin reductase (NADPH)
VLGSVAHAGSKALFLRTYSREVILFPTAVDGDRTELDKAGVAVASPPLSVVPEGKRVVVHTEDGARHVLDTLYPAMGCEVRSDLAAALGADCTDIGTLRVDDHQRTTVKGLFGAGDVVSDLHQLSVATGHAAIAATAIHNGLPKNMK